MVGRTLVRVVSYGPHDIVQLALLTGLAITFPVATELPATTVFLSGSMMSPTVSRRTGSTHHSGQATPASYCSLQQGEAPHQHAILTTTTTVVLHPLDKEIDRCRNLS